MSVRIVLKLRINVFAHCWNEGTFITVCTKTWQGESTGVSKIVRGLVSWGTRLLKRLEEFKT